MEPTPPNSARRAHYTDSSTPVLLPSQKQPQLITLLCYVLDEIIRGQKGLLAVSYMNFHRVVQTR